MRAGKGNGEWAFNCTIAFSLLKRQREFLGGSVVKTSFSNAASTGLILGGQGAHSAHTCLIAKNPKH